MSKGASLDKPEFYVLQRRKNSWTDSWEVLPGRYPTLKDAKEAWAKRFPRNEYRIAQPYVTIRYKAVREE